MNIDTEKLLSEYFNSALESIKKAIAIPSVRGKAEPQAPYGKPTKDVLDFAINLANSMGFKTYQDPQNHYGYVDYGTGKEIFAILGHLDVVPAGDLSKWDFEPFNPQVKDGKLLGRGSFDDKGPMILNLFALKYLKDHNFVPDYKIRLIFGLTEETDWDSIRTYLKKETTPAIGYTPDGEFPVVYAEKGILDVDLVNGGVPFILKGGEAYNCVNDIVTYKGPFIKEISEFLIKQKIEVIHEKDMITVKGQASHGSLPERGINAATYVLDAYAHFSKDCLFANFVQQHLHKDFAFSKFIHLSDETGVLVVNNGIVDFNHESSRLTLNMRVPVTYGKKDVLEPLIKTAKEYNIKVVEESWEPPVYIEQTNPLIVKIMNVYREVTGDKKAKPLAIGGGTYAKAFKNCVAFGAEFNLEESTMHAYNEFVKISDLKKMLEIYTKALVLLTKKEKD